MSSKNVVPVARWSTLAVRTVIAAAFISTISASTALAFQEVYGVNVTNTRQLNAGGDIMNCRIEISQDHAVTNITNNCKRRTFSWDCLKDDYRFERAEESRNRGLPINLRYSEFSCHDGNMWLLTVW